MWTLDRAAPCQYCKLLHRAEFEPKDIKSSTSVLRSTNWAIEGDAYENRVSRPLEILVQRQKFKFGDIVNLRLYLAWSEQSRTSEALPQSIKFAFCSFYSNYIGKLMAGSTYDVTAVEQELAEYTSSCHSRSRYGVTCQQKEEKSSDNIVRWLRRLHFEDNEYIQSLDC